MIAEKITADPPEENSAIIFGLSFSRPEI